MRIAVILGLAFSALAQNSALVIQINPEAHLDPSTIQLTFPVTNPGEVVTSQPVTVTAWVRALPGQQIHLTAQMSGLTGPSLQWQSASGRATGGGTTAVCASGDFSSGQTQQLIQGWTQSGIATCTLTFSLATQSTWQPGTYTGSVALNLSAQ